MLQKNSASRKVNEPQYRYGRIILNNTEVDKIINNGWEKEQAIINDFFQKYNKTEINLDEINNIFASAQKKNQELYANQKKLKQDRKNNLKGNIETEQEEYVSITIHPVEQAHKASSRVTIIPAAKFWETNFTKRTSVEKQHRIIKNKQKDLNQENQNLAK